nr:hypothetical protein [Candidatus Sigynarchaeota archaeon]
MKLPKIDAFRDNIKVQMKPGAAPPQAQVDAETLKKRQEVIKKIQDKIAEIEKCLNTADYKKAYKIAAGEILKYTPQSIQGNDLLERMASMAETALEYMHTLAPESDDAFLDFLGGEMEDYKDVPLFKSIERMLADRLKRKIARFKKEGRDAWIAPWIETWKPVVVIVDEQKALNKFLAGEDANLKWKFKIPVQYSPGEKQRLLEKRKKINDALTSKAAELEKEKPRVPAPSQPFVEPVPVLPVEPVEFTKSASSSGMFSKKKATTNEPAKQEQKEQKKHKPHPKKSEPKALSKEDDHISSSEVKEYLFKLKHEQNVNEVHFVKIKNDLNAISLNKEKKLFKILEALGEKGIVIRKQGSYYAILF